MHCASGLARSIWQPHVHHQDGPAPGATFKDWMESPVVTRASLRAVHREASSVDARMSPGKAVTAPLSHPVPMETSPCPSSRSGERLCFGFVPVTHRDEGNFAKADYTCCTQAPQRRRRLVRR